MIRPNIFDPPTTKALSAVPFVDIRLVPDPLLEVGQTQQHGSPCAVPSCPKGSNMAVTSILQGQLIAAILRTEQDAFMSEDHIAQLPDSIVPANTGKVSVSSNDADSQHSRTM